MRDLNRLREDSFPPASSRGRGPRVEGSLSYNPPMLYQEQDSGVSPARPADPLLSIVLPVFNEEAVLGDLRERLLAVLPALGLRWEVIFVDDGSSDRTLQMLREFHLAEPRFKVLSFTRNFGHQVAVTAGLMRCSGDVVVVLDADLQDPPELLSDFLNLWERGYDVVYGVRQKRKERLFKRVAYFVFYRLVRRLVDFDLPLDSGDFGLMDKRVVAALNALPERGRFVRGLRAWVGFRQIGLRYQRQARAAGETKYPIHKLVSLALDGIFSFSVKPLRLLSFVGLLTSFAAFAAIVFFLFHRWFAFKIFGYSPQDVPGFTSVILSVLFIGGLQLLALGLIGEYVGRILSEVKMRPIFVAKEELGLISDSIQK